MIKNIILKAGMSQEVCHASTIWSLDDKTLRVENDDVALTIAADIHKRILEYVSEYTYEAVSVPSVGTIMAGLNNKGFTFEISESISVNGGVDEDSDELFEFFITNETKESTRYDYIFEYSGTYVAA